MRLTIEGPPGVTTPRRPLAARLAWFVGLALAGGASTAAVAYALKALLR